jgi:hypothetical protein
VCRGTSHHWLVHVRVRVVFVCVLFTRVVQVHSTQCSTPKTGGVVQSAERPEERPALAAVAAEGEIAAMYSAIVAEERTSQSREAASCTSLRRTFLMLSQEATLSHMQRAEADLAGIENDRRQVRAS